MTLRPILVTAAPVPGPQERYPIDKVLQGQPTYKLSQQYEEPTAQFFSGTWEAGPCVINVCYASGEHEFCVILEGEVRLVGNDGHCMTARSGDAFVVPGGWQGTWECVGRVRKYYASTLLKTGA